MLNKEDYYQGPLDLSTSALDNYLSYQSAGTQQEDARCLGSILVLASITYIYFVFKTMYSLERNSSAMAFKKKTTREVHVKMMVAT